MNKILRALLSAKDNIEKNSIEYKLSDERTRSIFMNGFDLAVSVVIEESEKEEEKKNE